MALKLMGTFFWPLDKPGKALRWWNKSIDEGERLCAKLELSRTYFEVGKRTLAGMTPSPALPLAKGEVDEGRRGSVKKILGLTPEQCLDKAEAMFREMDLQWDLEQLEKARQGIKG